MSKRESKKFTLTAYSLRIILIIIMLLIVAIGTTGLSLGVQMMKEYAVEVSHKKVDAAASSGNLRNLQETQEYLEQHKDVLEKIGMLRSTNEFPEFKVVDEVRKIAAKNNIQIASFSYGTEASSGTATPAAGTSPAPAPKAGTNNTIALTTTLSTSNYLDFLQFTYDIEQHIPKMKINGISIANGSTASETGTPTTSGIAVQPVTIEMYIQ